MTKSTNTKAFQLDEFYLDLQGDGRELSIISDIKADRNPFPGLRPFKSSEHHLFFGRDGQADQLMRRLVQNRFLSVLGSSGTGKSSLVRAGLLPHLQGGYLRTKRQNWDIAICRPGLDPVTNLAAAIASIKSRNDASDDLMQAMDVIEPMLSRNPYGLLSVENLLNSKREDKEKANLLVVVDQFEELFRYKREQESRYSISQAEKFVNLLINATSEGSNNIYVIITMRSEFLGECIVFRDLPETINKAQYLVPRLNRLQIAEVIEGPLSMVGKEISPILVNQLIDEIGDNMDQLPILQHALMRTYHFFSRDPDSAQLEIKHYNEAGGMEHALSKHAKDKYDELNDREQSIARLIFQSLTDRTTDGKGIRRPIKLNFIYEICEVLKYSRSEVDKVINHFRHSDTSFLMPPINTKLNPNLIIDISHESLMRNWNLLNEWIDEEVWSANLYRRLNVSRENTNKIKEEQSDPDPSKYDWIKGGLLDDMKKMKAKYPLSPAWAFRYNSDAPESENEKFHSEVFNANMAFLEDSIKEDERIRRERRRKTGMILGLLGLLAAIFLGLTIWLNEHNAELIKLKEEADLKRIEADSLRKVDSLRAITLEMQKDTAEMLKIEADSLRDEAVRETERAVRAEKKAEEEAKVARSERTKADSLKRVALTAARIAENQKAIADVQRDIAKEQKEEADKQRNKAQIEKFKTQASNLAYLSIIEDDPYLKKYLALEAYYLDSLYNKNSWNPDVQEALWEASLNTSKLIMVSTNSGILDFIMHEGQLIYLNARRKLVWHNREKEKELNKDFFYEQNSLKIQDNIILKSISGKTVCYDKQLEPIICPIQDINPEYDYEGSTIQIGKQEVTYNGNSIIKFKNENIQPTVIAQSPNKHLLAVGLQNGWLYMVDFRKPIKDMLVIDRQQHEVGSIITDIEFDKNEKYIATSGLDGQVLLNHIEGAATRRFAHLEHSSWVNGIQFIENDKILVCTQAGQIYSYPYNQDNLANEICRRLDSPGERPISKMRLDTVNHVIDSLMNLCINPE